MSWKDHLDTIERQQLQRYKLLAELQRRELFETRREINTLRKRANKRMERAKAKERDNDHP